MSKHTMHKSVKFVIVFCIALVLILAFWLLIHPFVAYLFFDGVEYIGLGAYRDESYLQHPGGKAFQQEITKLGFVDECEVIGFYYVNNWPKDSLFYGKICDVFCLDLDAGYAYYSINSTAHSKSQDTLPLGDWKINLLTPHSFDEDYKFDKDYKDYFFIATNDNTKTIRCLMVVDYKGDITLDFRSIFIRYTSLEW